ELFPHAAMIPMTKILMNTPKIFFFIFLTCLFTFVCYLINTFLNKLLYALFLNQFLQLLCSLAFYNFQLTMDVLLLFLSSQMGNVVFLLKIRIQQNLAI